ncbi:hypothetical protein GWK47_049204 [Chionoecetes opilio]|uniref:Uncharacterized protein n=1 Tax=Chionoecetes opilio TaxID=41210 RepID=A0A8J4Y3R6_CHIOP|nr:hypothetical protein GWK47_049204 [Chionoecetes opilio]
MIVTSTNLSSRCDVYCDETSKMADHVSTVAVKTSTQTQLGVMQLHLMWPQYSRSKTMSARFQFLRNAMEEACCGAVCFS